MSTLLNRTQRALSCFVALVFVATLVAPIMATAGSDLVAGDTAVVGGSGANLRSDNSTTDSINITADLPAGTKVTILEGPLSTVTGVWYYVDANGQGGYVSADLLSKADAAATTPPTAEPTLEATATQATSLIPWSEPIDHGVVVDNTGELSAEGLPVRTESYGNGTIIGHAPVGSALDVTSRRESDGATTWVRVNFNDGGGYVNGKFITLDSDAAAATEVPTEALATEAVPTQVPTDVSTPTEVVPTQVPTDVPTEVVPTQVPTDVSTPTILPTEPAATQPSTPEVLPTEVLPTEPAATQPSTPEAVDPNVPAAPSTPDVLPTESVDATATVAPATPGTDVVTPAPEVFGTPTSEAGIPAVNSTPSAPSQPSTPVANTPVATQQPATPGATTAVGTKAPATATATTVAQKQPTNVAPKATSTVAPKVVTATTSRSGSHMATNAFVSRPAASSVPSIDASTKILGTATVEGTTFGLHCRVAGSDDSPIIMTVSEGTKVQVWDNPVDGYAGIICGGLKGYAQVKFLMAHGAADGEITKANMGVVVNGSGSGLNCRVSASLSGQVIAVIPDGTALVTRGAAGNGWTPVKCAGQNGYVYTQYVKVSGSTGSGSSTQPSGSASSTGVVTGTNGDGLRCRAGAGTGYAVITTIGPGASVTVRGSAQGGWTPVTCGGKAGWVYSSFLTVKPGGTATSPNPPTTPKPSTGGGTVTIANTGGERLNCRAGAGTTYPVITSLALGQSVTVRSGSVNGWTAVVCGGQNGFISSQYAKQTSGGNPGTAPKPTPPSGTSSGSNVKTTDSLNLRYAPGGTIQQTLPAGTVVRVIGGDGVAWYKVDYDGLQGWVHGDYVVKTSEALSKRGGSGTPGQNPAPSAPPVSGGGNSSLVSYAMKYTGYPYVWATHGPSSFDCSGFTGFVVQQVLGKDIGYSTWSQYGSGTPISKSQLQPGDLVFFQNTYTTGLSHVGIYIGNGQFIHAQNEDTGVVVSDLNSTYYGPRWYGARRM